MTTREKWQNMLMNLELAEANGAPLIQPARTTTNVQGGIPFNPRLIVRTLHASSPEQQFRENVDYLRWCTRRYIKAIQDRPVDPTPAMMELVARVKVTWDTFIAEHAQLTWKQDHSKRIHEVGQVWTGAEGNLPLLEDPDLDWAPFAGQDTYRIAWTGHETEKERLNGLGGGRGYPIKPEETPEGRVETVDGRLGTFDDGDAMLMLAFEDAARSSRNEFLATLD